MSRYTGARLRIIRRLGSLPGLTQKEPQSWNLPGQHGGTGKRRESQYACRLKEKQKLRYHYGLTEKQLVNYVRKAKKNKQATGDTLIKMLEMRLDNIIFRFGVAPTIPAARQLVSHQHVLVNHQVISYPGYQVRAGQSVGLQWKKLVDQKGSSMTSAQRLSSITEEISAVDSVRPSYLSLRPDVSHRLRPGEVLDNLPHANTRSVANPNSVQIGRVSGEARPEDVPFPLDMRLVIEYYARKI
jgi:small subunit ribosomal protein S4